MCLLARLPYLEEECSYSQNRIYDKARVCLLEFRRFAPAVTGSIQIAQLGHALHHLAHVAECAAELRGRGRCTGRKRALGVDRRDLTVASMRKCCLAAFPS